jgi:phenylacetate-coenzyme A ligase PaaK-like adenylate-forming protein
LSALLGAGSELMEVRMRLFLLDPIEMASRDEIIALKTRRLAATLRRSHDVVPAMRAKFDRHGVHPADFRALADLECFPFTTAITMAPSGWAARSSPSRGA